MPVDSSAFYISIALGATAAALCVVCLLLYRRLKHARAVQARVEEALDDMMEALQRETRSAAEARDYARHASKLASIGEFAAGLAHEINNPLDGIMSCVARLQRDPSDLAQNMEYLALMQHALRRMCNTVQRLLEYAHPHELVLEATSLHDVINNVITLIGTSARRGDLSITFEAEDNVPLVIGDRHFLAQAFLNLALNAMAATGEGGEIRFRARPVEPDNGKARFAAIEVIDNGTGIPPEDRDRVFTPFFTTKTAGTGTGLGLAIVKSIVDDHHGTISIDSTPGVGTTVRMLLPSEPGNAAIEDTEEKDD